MYKAKFLAANYLPSMDNAEPLLLNINRKSLQLAAPLPLNCLRTSPRSEDLSCPTREGVEVKQLLAKPTPGLHDGHFGHCKGCAHPNEEVPIIGLVVHTGGKNPIFSGPQTLGCLTKVVQCLL